MSRRPKSPLHPYVIYDKDQRDRIAELVTELERHQLEQGEVPITKQLATLQVANKALLVALNQVVDCYANESGPISEVRFGQLARLCRTAIEHSEPQ